MRNNPTGWNAVFVNIANHTPGTPDGLYMVVNGATIGGIPIWQETGTVSPNTTYTFTGYVASAVSGPPPILELLFNGQSTGPSFTAPATAGAWAEMSWDWNSGTNTGLTLTLQNANTAVFPNDFYLDDFTLTEKASPPVATPEPAGITLFGLGLLGLGSFRARRWFRRPAAVSA